MHYVEVVRIHNHLSKIVLLVSFIKHFELHSFRKIGLKVKILNHREN